ncbi:MAG: SEL1-like repeat protein [Polyangiaceae bacterium]|nr:SEL1-like repeat protein [Polyangiaceae bacterium]
MAVAVVLDGPEPLLLGQGLASDGFSVAFAREALFPDGSDTSVPPKIYVVISLPTPAEDGFEPVMRYDVDLSRIDDEGRLGTITLPLRKGERPKPPPGLVCAPGDDRARKHLNLDHEIIFGASMMANVLVDQVTGWGDLLEGVRFEIVEDFAAATRNRFEAVLDRSDFDAREAEIIEDAGRGFPVAAMWDPFSRRVLLCRPELEQQNFGFLVVTIGHELVHVGQSKNHPELDTYLKGELARRWTALLAGDKPGPNAELFGFMANIEGYADYVERYHVARMITCSMQLERQVPSKAAIDVTPRRKHDCLDLLEEPQVPTSLRNQLMSQKSAQYDSGRHVYAKRAQAGALARFDPSLRPEPLVPEAWLGPLTSRALGGCITSQLTLGDIYRTGGMAGVTADKKKATRWYRLAAAAGSTEAAEHLAKLG